MTPLAPAHIGGLARYFALLSAIRPTGANPAPLTITYTVTLDLNNPAIQTTLPFAAVLLWMMMTQSVRVLGVFTHTALNQHDLIRKTKMMRIEYLDTIMQHDSDQDDSVNVDVMD